MLVQYRLDVHVTDFVMQFLFCVVCSNIFHNFFQMVYIDDFGEEKDDKKCDSPTKYAKNPKATIFQNIIRILMMLVVFFLPLLMVRIPWRCK